MQKSEVEDMAEYLREEIAMPDKFYDAMFVRGQRVFAAFVILFVILVLNSLYLCPRQRRTRLEDALQILAGFSLMVAMGLLFLAGVMVTDRAIHIGLSQRMEPMLQWCTVLSVASMAIWCGSTIFCIVKRIAHRK